MTLLHPFGQLPHLRAFLLIGGSDMQGQQMAQAVDCHVHLAPALPFGPVIAGPGAALRRGRPRAAGQDRCRRLLCAAFGQPQHDAQVMHHRFERASTQPALGLLIHRCPRRQVIWHHPPRRPRPCQPAQAIEHFAQRMGALGRLFSHERQIWGDKRPFIVTHIAGVGFPFHAPSVASFIQGA